MSLVRSLVGVGAIVLLLDFFFGQYFLDKAGLSHQNDAPSELRIEHQRLHHALAPGFAGIDCYRGEHCVDLCTNDQGNRVSCLDENGNLASKTIIFFGDSFTEGVGVPYEETFVAKIGNNLGVETQNWGVSSYSAVNYLVQAELFDIKNTDCFVVMSDPSDIFNALSYKLVGSNVVANVESIDNSYRHQRSVRKVISEFVYNYFPVMNRSLVTIRNLVFGIPIQYDYINRDYPITRHWVRGYTTTDESRALNTEIDRIASLFRKLQKSGRNHRYLVTYPWPSQLVNDYVVETPEAITSFREVASGLEVEYIDLRVPVLEHISRLNISPLEIYIKGDVHFNELGHQILADILTKELHKSCGRGVN